MKAHQRWSLSILNNRIFEDFFSVEISKVLEILHSIGVAKYGSTYNILIQRGMKVLNAVELC